MKILVTGGTGLVGQAIQSIKDKYSEHTFIFSSSRDCDLINYLDTYRYFSQIKPDYIIHLAAIVGGLFKNMNHKVDMYDQNMRLNMNVLHPPKRKMRQNLIKNFGNVKSIVRNFTLRLSNFFHFFFI